MTLTEIQARIQELELSQKQVAARMEERLGQKAGHEVTHSTLVTKLSKALNRDPEGLAFFRQVERAEALALALKLPVDAVLSAINATQLLLDPRLPEVVVAALRRQAAAAAIDTELIELSAVRAVHRAPLPEGDGRVLLARSTDEGIRASLRAASDSNPLAIVVLACDDDLGWFEGARRKTTFIAQVPRGYVLEINPALAPVPQPALAARWDGATPMFAHPELTAGVREVAKKAGRTLEEATSSLYSYRRDLGAKTSLPAIAHDALEQLFRRLFAADKRGEEPAFPLKLVASWIVSRLAAEGPIEFPQADQRTAPVPTGAQIQLALDDILQTSRRTVVWWSNERLFAWGPAVAAVAAVMRPHHEVVTEVVELTRWRDALDHVNPFGAGFDAVMRAALDKAGVSLAQALGAWRKRVAAETSEPASVGDAGSDGRIEVYLGVDAEAEGARVVLRRIARARFSVTREDLTLCLRLEAASRAPIGMLPKHRFDVVHALANLGAGRVVRVRVAEWDSPVDQEPLRVTRRANDASGALEFDGGNLHVWIERLTDEDLEGTALPPRARRRAKAAERAADHDDE